MQCHDLVVVGAGLAGLTVARGAAEAGLDVAVIDKGRGLGGRMATRRAEGGFQFDHGAQYFRPRADAFHRLLQTAVSAGAAAPWPAAGDGIVGVPGMNALPKFLGKGLAITTGRRVGAIARHERVWEITDTDGVPALRGRALVLAMPAPQIAMVLGPDHLLARPLSEVRFAPCWALMVGFAARAPLPEVRRDEDVQAPISWLAHDGAKPGRGDTHSYVAHASADWSRVHLEEDAETVAGRLLVALQEIAGGALPAIRHLSAHRWRFSTADLPLGRPMLAQPDERLYLCGDWCLGNRAEHAWQSGLAVLHALAPAQAAVQG